MRLGIGLGLFKQGAVSVGVRLFSAYKSRVIADGGTVEADNCGISALNNSLFRQASLLLIPSGYKSGKAYAEIPTNGNGDLTWTRASTALRTNSSGLLESMGSGVPRLSYMYGSCPALLLEPQRTNVAQNSGFVGTGSAPTNWAQPGGTGTSSLTSSTLGVGVQACSQSATAQRPFLQQDFAVSANTTYTFSIYIESISGTINYNNTMLILNPPIGATVAYFLDGVSINETTQATTGRLSMRLVVGALTGTISMRCGLGTSSNVTASILFSRPQLEVGAYTTTFILTGVGATATRIADSFSRNNIYTNGLITSEGGTWFVELRGNLSLTRDSSDVGLFVGNSSNGTSGDVLAIRNNGTGRLSITKRISGTQTGLYTTTTDTVKIAIKWNGSTADVFVNGTKQVSATSFTATNMEFFNGSGEDVTKFIQAMGLFTTPQTDQFCQDITTL